MSGAVKHPSNQLSSRVFSPASFKRSKSLRRGKADAPGFEDPVGTV